MQSQPSGGSTQSGGSRAASREASRAASRAGYEAARGDSPSASEEEIQPPPALRSDVPAGVEMQQLGAHPLLAPPDATAPQVEVLIHISPAALPVDDPRRVIVWQITELSQLEPGGVVGSAAHVAGNRAAVGQSIAAVATEASTALSRESLVKDYGVDQKRFETFCQATGSVWSPSASAGRTLTRLNDTAGILIVPAKTGETMYAERFEVITEGVGGDKRYFVKGYANRVVKFSDFQAAVAGMGADARDDIPRGNMETALRSAVRDLSEKSELIARRDRNESDVPVLPGLPNCGAVSSKAVEWANYEDALPPGFGPTRPEQQPEPAGAAAQPELAEEVMPPLPNYKFHYDWNKIENRIVIFENKWYADPAARPLPPQGAKRYESVKLEGPVLAQIDGIDHVEVLGPVDRYGVKLVKLRRHLPCADYEHLTLRITTKDAAVHELILTPTGARMRLINPMPGIGLSSSGRVFNCGGHSELDFDVYSYRGLSTGLHGSPAGFSDPQLLTSCGDSIPCGPLIKRVGGVGGATTVLLKGAGNILLLHPLPGAELSSLMVALQTVLRVTLTTLYVYILTRGVDDLRHGPHKTILGGDDSFSAFAHGALSPGETAKVVCEMVIVQEFLTFLGQKIWHITPDSYKTGDSKGRRFFLQFLVPLIGDFTRLLANWIIQKANGVPRGGGQDILMLFLQAFGVGIATFVAHRVGHPENHRYFQFLLTAVDLSLDFGMRSANSAWNAANLAHKALTPRAFAEALITRVITRGDKVIARTFFEMLDANGFVGEHGGAYDEQTSYEARMSGSYESWCQVVDHFSQTALATADSCVLAAARCEERAAEMMDACRCLMLFSLCIDSIKPALQNLSLGRISYDQEHSDDRHHVDQAVRAIKQGPEAVKELMEEQKRRWDEMVKKGMQLNEAGAGSVAQIEEIKDEKKQKAISFASDNLPPRFNERARLLQDSQPQYSWHHYPVLVYYEGSSYGTDSKSGNHKRVKRDLTTFSNSGQKAAKPVHDAMSRDPGIMSIERLDDRLALPHVVVSRIRKAVRDYTVESQMFHYPLRWPLTGQKRIVAFGVPGMTFAYNVMNSRSGELFDPIGALYINLGALRSPKFPSVGYRAVVTEAEYVNQPPQEKSARGPLEAITLLMFLATTEFFSVSLSQEMAATFGMALGYGAAAKKRCQLMVLLDETAINIAPLTDLVQAEKILTPGALYKPRFVDATGGLGSAKPQPAQPAQPAQSAQSAQSEQPEQPEQPARDGGAGQSESDETRALGQVVYMEQVDTAELMEYGLRHRAGEVLDRDIRTYIDPENGHLFVRGDDDQWHLDSTRNYVVGNKMERAVAGEPNTPSTRVARWLEPYTSDYAPRATKDAIHAAILTEDPITLGGLLNEAIKNTNHEYFLAKGDGHHALRLKRVQQDEQIKAAAKGLIAPFCVMQLGSRLEGEQLQWTAWMLVSMLQTPVLLVELGDLPPQGGKIPGGEIKAKRLSTPYNSVDISVTVEGTPNPDVMIGVSKNGFSVIEWKDGYLVATPMNSSRAGGDPHNMAEFLHAYYRASRQSPPNAYVFNPRTGSYAPENAARKTVGALLDKMQEFAQTDYIVLHRSIVRFAGEEMAVAPALQLAPAQEKEESQEQPPQEQPPQEPLAPLQEPLAAKPMAQSSRVSDIGKSAAAKLRMLVSAGPGQEKVGDEETKFPEKPNAPSLHHYDLPGVGIGVSMPYVPRDDIPRQLRAFQAAVVSLTSHLTGTYESQEVMDHEALVRATFAAKLKGTDGPSQVLRKAVAYVDETFKVSLEVHVYEIDQESRLMRMDTVGGGVTVAVLATQENDFQAFYAMEGEV